MKKDIKPSNHRWKVIRSHFEFQPHDLYVMEALDYQWEFPEIGKSTHFIMGSLEEIKHKVLNAAYGCLYRGNGHPIDSLYLFANKLEVSDTYIYAIDVIRPILGAGHSVLASVHITPY